VFTPKVTPSPAPGAAAEKAFDLARADVAGIRIGVKAKDLEASLNRMFGPTRRGPPSNANARFTGKVTLNEMGCVHLPTGRHDPKPGAVCVTALFDGSEVVRSIRVERVFSYFDAENFRKALTQKYGPVSMARSLGGSFSLGWGPDVDQTLAYDSSGPRNAVTAHYMTIDSFLNRSGNRIPEVRMVLQLVDARWAAGGK
jgi:hypothetical protein